MLLSLVIVVLAAAVLRHHVQGISWSDVTQALARQSQAALLASVGLTFLSFVALAAYDVMACRIVAPGRARVPMSAFAGFAANALANTLGFHAITSSAVRARIYRLAGIGMGDVARIISLSWLALGLGFLAMLALAMVLADRGAAGAAGFPLAPAGWGLGAGLLAFVAWLSRGPRAFRFRSFVQPLPPARVAAAQLLLGALESAAAIGALHVLLPPDLSPPFTLFSVAYIIAIWLGIAAHAPGGIGVFEAAMVTALAGTGRSDLLAVLLLYRLIYNVLPFLLAVASLALFELACRRSWFSWSADKA
jgi:uncharacterized membrane protein YbhN (UPF0104 family)